MDFPPPVFVACGRPGRAFVSQISVKYSPTGIIKTLHKQRELNMNLNTSSRAEREFLSKFQYLVQYLTIIVADKRGCTYTMTWGPQRCFYCFVE